MKIISLTAPAALALSAIAFMVTTPATAASLWTLDVGAAAISAPKAPEATTATETSKPVVTPPPVGAPTTYQIGEGNKAKTHDYTYKAVTTTKDVTSYQMSAPSLTGFTVGASAVKGGNGEEGRENSGSKNVSVTGTSVQHWDATKTMTVTQTQETITSQYKNDGHKTDQSFNSGWSAPEVVSSSTSEITGSKTGTGSKTYTSTSGFAFIDYDFSLSSSQKVNFTVSDVKSDLLGNLEFALVNKSGVVHGEMFTVGTDGKLHSGASELVANLAKLSDGSANDDNYHLVVAALNGFKAGDSFSISGHMSAVPVPAALPMFGAALIGMGGLARRRAKKSA